jgi:phospholipid/cholesterol/gamma-HCH transport system permease protein
MFNLSPPRSDPGNASPQAAVKLRAMKEHDVLVMSGEWIIGTIGAVDDQLTEIARQGNKPLKVDPSGIARMDTAGAWMVARMKRDGERARRPVEIGPSIPAYQSLLDQVISTLRPPPPLPRPVPGYVALLLGLGQFTIGMGARIARMLNFFGLLLVTIAGLALRPHQWRTTSMVFHMKAVGVDAMPIVGLMSFLIGVVLAYQGASQLQRFGAEVFTVNLIALSVLREIGILMTAILVAGRSGSAFTAAIGSMKLREEVDALRALGLNPVEVLVVPRALALFFTLPMLAVFAAMTGLLGGMIMCWTVLDISPVSFMIRLNEAVRINHFLVGVIKAPFFAIAIATIGCFEGFEVEGSAESVGRLTTVSVVESIFVVIVLDAIFSIFFATIDY